LTVPETVAISSDQYWQAVDVLALRILDYYHARHRAALPLWRAGHLRLADLPFPSYRKPQVRAGRHRQGVLMP
jgi:hypothetical protein